AGYCRDHFGFSDSRGRQLIAAARTVTDVTAAGLPSPSSEGEARRLARSLRQPEFEQWPPVRGLPPDITGEEWHAFVYSVAELGLLIPIVLYQGTILDGLQRYRACLDTGVR